MDDLGGTTGKLAPPEVLRGLAISPMAPVAKSSAAFTEVIWEWGW